MIIYYYLPWLPTDKPTKKYKHEQNVAPLDISPFLSKIHPKINASSSSSQTATITPRFAT